MTCHAETVFGFNTPVSSHHLNYLSDQLLEAFENTPRHASLEDLGVGIFYSANKDAPVHAIRLTFDSPTADHSRLPHLGKFVNIYKSYLGCLVTDDKDLPEAIVEWINTFFNWEEQTALTKHTRTTISTGN